MSALGIDVMVLVPFMSMMPCANAQVRLRMNAPKLMYPCLL